MDNESPLAAGTTAASSRAAPELTVVIPAHNDAVRLPATLDAVGQFLDDWGLDYKVLVVDDGSRDATARLTAGRGPRFSTYSLPRNRGKGAAVRSGMLQAHSRLVAFMDADLPYALDCLRQGYEAMQAGGPDVVLGARNIPGAENRVRRRWLRKAASVVFRGITHCLISNQVSDSQAGFKMFRQSASQQIFSCTTVDGFAFDVEVVLLMQRLRLPFAEVPLILINDWGSTLSLWRDTLPMLLDVLRLSARAHRGAYDSQAPAPAAATRTGTTTKGPT
jgi:dolichyl-phosphate beta-glucosyltransferase